MSSLSGRTDDAADVAHAGYQEYLLELSRLVRELPMLERSAEALYLRGSLAAGDLTLGESDLDLVLVLRDDPELETESLAMLRPLFLHRKQLGYRHLSVPKTTSAADWRQDRMDKSAEYGFRTVVEDELVWGRQVVDATWLPAPGVLEQAVRDSLQRHFIRAHLCFSQLLRRHFPRPAKAWFRRAVTRFLRFALWARLGVFVAGKADVRRVAARVFGPGIGLLDGESQDWVAVWDQLEAVRRAAGGDAAGDEVVPDCPAETRVDEWRSIYLVPFASAVTTVLWTPRPDDDVRARACRLMDERGLVAVLPPALAVWFARRMAPRTLVAADDALARAAGVSPEDVVQDARSELAYFRFNWRNMYLGSPDATGHFDVRKLTLRFASVLDALSALADGQLARAPREALDNFRATHPAAEGSEFLDRFLTPAFSGDVDDRAWAEHMPRFARAVCVPPGRPRGIEGVR